MTTTTMELRAAQRWADHRRWAYLNIGAMMCSLDTGQLHGPALWLEPMPPAPEPRHETVRLFEPAPVQVPGQLVMGGCGCPDDCGCRHPWRTNYCGCRAHESAEQPQPVVTFEIGRRTLQGTVSALVANGTKCAIDTPEGEYVLPLDCLSPADRALAMSAR